MCACTDQSLEHPFLKVLYMYKVLFLMNILLILIFLFYNFIIL